jgi:acyl-CoA synthetase (AMP-forming)/AMP-acid ligase II
MIAGVLHRHSRHYPDRTFLSTATRQRSYAECEAEVNRITGELDAYRGASCAVEGRPDADAILRLIALDRIGARIYLLPPGVAPSQVQGLGESVGAEVPPGGAGPAVPNHPGSGPGEVVLFTSGTTGVPKAVLHTWGSLSGRVHHSDSLDASHWLLTYHLSAFAGLQVFLHALENAGQITLGPSDPASLLALGLRDGVTHISGTPTFFRLLLTLSRPEELHRLPLRQVTLGGEAVDQLLLDRLRAAFPQARITHIYASTEAGACFSVHDGHEGFPTALLESDALPVRLSIVEGELFVDSPHVMRGYLGPDGARRSPGPIATGDLVEIRGDRVLFLGRRSERINVGGNKVHPEEVERRILEVPGVQAARVSGAASSLVGQIVRADVVVEPGSDPDQMRQRILDHCRTGLAAYKLPRLLTFVDRLDCTAAGKLVRGAAR